MKTNIKWVTGIRTNEVHLAQQSANKYGITQGSITFHFGSWKQPVQVHISTDFPVDRIGLPEQWKNNFTIPDILPYELRRNGSTLCLGPVIALIVFSDRKQMTLSELDKYRDYFHDYSNMKGLIYLCAWNEINTEKKQIQGYYFDPNSSDHPRKCWKLGTFPYPGAAYNRTAMPKTIFNDMLTVMGDRIFNSFSNGSFNKWELWNRLSPVPQLRTHLPATKPLKDLKGLDHMLDKYGSIYLKPTGGTLSKGIMKLERSKSRYLVTYPQRKRKGNGTIHKYLENAEDIKQWFNELKQTEYLAQQAVTMKRYENRPIDFRVIMQKNGRDRWNCTGIFGKFGKKGSIITNFMRSGYIRTGTDTFRLAFRMNDLEARNKMDELTSIAHQICRVFDGYGNYGDLGIDLMVDDKGKVWILEVNTLDTYHRFPIHLDDRALYHKVVTSPFRYAKYLAGFPQ